MKKFLLLGAAALTLLAAAPAIAAPHNSGQPQYHQDQARGHDNDRDYRGNDNRGPFHNQNARRFFYNGQYYNSFRDTNWRAPRGYVQREWRRGQFLPVSYRARAYVVDYRAFHLRPAPRGYQWVRVGNDVYLVSMRTGMINQVVLNIFFR
jgi:Ni/Co efflux regulator RcnB